MTRDFCLYFILPTFHSFFTFFPQNRNKCLNKCSTLTFNFMLNCHHEWTLRNMFHVFLWISVSLRLCVTLLSFSGGRLTHSRRTKAKFAQQRILRSLSPSIRQYGGYSRVIRRFLRRKIRRSAARPLLLAVYFGGNFRNCINFNAQRNISSHSYFLGLFTIHF